MPDISRNFDARRTVTAYIARNIDVQAMVPYSLENYSSLNITLQAHTLSDSFSMTVPKGTATIDDVITGELFGWDYDFTVAETETRNQVRDYIGRYSVDKLHYTNYRYSTKERYRPYGATGNYSPKAKVPVSVRYLMGKIASQLGLNLSYNAWDWSYPLPLIRQDYSYGYYGISGTYQALITSIFGWLSQLPNIDFNVTIRNGTLYVVQRGQEPSSYEIENVAYPPAVHVSKMRTEWSGNADWPQNELDAEGEQEPFTGTLQFGTAYYMYVNGLLVEQRNNLEITKFKYEYLESGDGDPQNYLTEKETILYDDSSLTEGSCSKTTYTYGYIGNDIYLQSEYEETGGEYSNGNSDYSDATKTETTHTPLGNGWYGHTVKDVEEDEVTSTSLSQGNPSNAITPYMVDKTQNILRSEWSYAVEGLVAILLYFANPPLIPTNYPVMDRSTLQKLVDDTDWLDGRKEETVTIDVLDNHIIDFTQKIKYNNNYYHLESNNITHDAVNGLRQSIVMKRWY